MNMTPEERELLNTETLHDEGPSRVVGSITLDVPSFRRRRLMARAFDTMRAAGATEAELLYTWIFTMAAPIERLRKIAGHQAAFEAALDDFFEETFPADPNAMGAQLQAARAIFDHDMAQITAAAVDVENQPGTTDRTEPPNS